MRTRSLRAMVALLAGATLLLGACGSKTTPSGGGGDQSSGTGGGGGTFKIAYMGILTGANFVKGADNGFKLAVKEINAAGGILGKQIEYKEFDTDITPQGAVNATNLALQYEPNVIVGYGVSAGLKASIEAINEAGIPVVHGTLASLTSPESLGSDLTFRVGPTTFQYAEAADGYLFDKLGVKKLTIIHTQDSAPTEGGKYIAESAAKAGVTVVERAVAPTVTDMSEPIQAAKGSDAIWNWGYATTDALTIKTAAQNGLSIPIMTFSAGSAARNNLVPKEELTDKILQVASCAPWVLPGDASKKYTEAFTKEYGTPPNDSSGNNFYDAVNVIKEAAVKANSLDPKKIAEGMAQVDVAGACGQLKMDPHHNFIHNVPILSFPGGEPKLVQNVENLTSPF